MSAIRSGFDEGALAAPLTGLIRKKSLSEITARYVHYRKKIWTNTYYISGKRVQLLFHVNYPVLHRLSPECATEEAGFKHFAEITKAVVHFVEWIL